MADHPYELMTEKRVIRYLKKIVEKPLQRMLVAAIAALVNNPNQQGHWLNGKLEGYKALDNLSYQGVPYRVIFRTDNDTREITVEDVGTHEEYNRRVKTGF